MNIACLNKYKYFTYRFRYLCLKPYSYISLPEFYINKYHSNYDILNQIIIDDLAQLILSFIAKRLRIGDVIDVLDTERKWYLSYIENIDHDKIFIHYLGWMDRWNEWIDISSDRIRLNSQPIPEAYKISSSFKIYNVLMIHHNTVITHLDKQIYIKTYSPDIINLIINKLKMHIPRYYQN